MTVAVLAAALALAAPEAQAQPPSPRAQPPATRPAAPPADPTVSDVTVSGARQQVETSIDRRSYSVANDLNGRTGTIGDVLRNVPSVQVDMQGNVSLRGDPGVTVLVDGRPSAQFSRDNLANALQSVPADQIERIEVITNPSAEFRVDGSGGIINLVMKKARGVGRTGTLRVNAASNGNVDGTLSGGFNSDRLSVVSSLAVRHGEPRTTGQYDRTIIGGGVTSTDVLNGSADPNGAFGRLSVDYDLSRVTRLSSSLSGAWEAGQQIFIDDFTQFSGAAPVLAFNRRGDSDIENRNAQLDFTLRNKWSDSHTLTLSTAFSNNEGRNTRIDTATPILPAGLAEARQTTRNNFNRRAAFTADYQTQIGGGVQLKAGYLAEYIDNLIEHRGGVGPSAGSVVQTPGQTDVFSDIETHQNAYVTLQKKVGSLTALGGLRAERVQLDLTRRTAGVEYAQDYRKLYPTLHLTYGLGEGRSLTASYSKRVSRPIPLDLDPYIFLSTTFNAIQGNPALTPQDTDSYEAIFEKRKGQAFTQVTAYYRQTNNAFSNVLVDAGNGVLLQTRSNLGYQSNAGVEWAMGDRLSPKLTYNLSINVFETRISDSTPGVTGQMSATTGFGRANLNWQVTKKDFVQINLFANSKQLFRQGYVEPTISGNIGWRHAVNDKLSLMMVARDPFATMTYRGVFRTPTSQEVRVQDNNSRSFSLGLIWNFAGKARDAGFDFGPGGTAGASSGP